MHNDDIPTYFGVRFTDGHRMWLSTDSPSEVLLHPVFLKYTAMCILLVSMLDRGWRDVGLIHGQQIALLWFFLGATGLAYYGSVFYMIQFLAVRRIISSIFTPLIVLPNLIIIHFVTNQVVTFLGNDVSSLELQVTDFLRDLVILLVFDVIFSNFVAYRHPAFSTTPVDLQLGRRHRPALEAPRDVAVDLSRTQPPPAPEISADVSDKRRKLLPEPVSSAFKDLQIGGKTFNPADIIALRSEDHYVNVYTATQKHLVRARLSEAVDRIDPRLGVKINRSTWLAFTGMASFSTTDGPMVAVLPDGSEESVAVMRRHAVRFAYETYTQSLPNGASEKTTP